MKTQILCTPTDQTVILLVDNLGNVTFKNPDNTAYTGDTSLLGKCCCDETPATLVDNGDGSFTYINELGFATTITYASAVHSNDVQAVPYTGTELPSIAGVNVDDTNTTQFSDGTVANYTYDGAVWVLDFAVTPAPKPTLTTVTGGTVTLLAAP